MKISFRYAVLISGFFGLSACSLKAVAPGPILETPTVATQNLSVGMQFGNRPAQAITITRDYSARPVNLSDRSVDEQYEFYFGPNVTFKKFEAKLDLSLNVGSTLRFKYQFLGPVSEESKEGDWTGAASIQLVGGTHSKSSGTQTGSSSDVSYKGTSTLSGTGLGVSLGHYVAERFVVFVGYTHMDYNLKYEITQDASGTNPATKYTGAESGWASTAGLGGQFFLQKEKRFYLVGSLQHQRRPWVLSSGREGLGYELGMHFSF